MSRAAGSDLHPRDGMLDGLRGSAVVAVVYVHFLFYSGHARPGGGYVGVLVFFVLSGYLITRVLWLRGSGDLRNDYRTFVRRRVRRLYPPLVVMVLLSAPLLVAFGPGDAHEAAVGSVAALTQTTALWFGANQPVFEPLVPTWSLTVEWVFYLLWPLALLRLRARGLGLDASRRVALGAAAVLFVVSLPLPSQQFYLLPLANVGVMLVGAGLALSHLGRSDAAPGGRDPQISDLAFLLFLVIVFLPSAGATGVWVYRFTQFPIAIIAAYLVIDQRPGTGGIARRLLESRPMRTIGITSYSTYLWHLPVLWVVWWGLHDLPANLRLLLALGILVPVVWASYTFVEKPWLSGRRPEVRSTMAAAKAEAASLRA